MKVICINNKPIPNTFSMRLDLIKEGEIYNVHEERKSIKVDGTRGHAYRLVEFMQIHKREKFSFSSQRFIPLSSIDEMELINEREAVIQ